jgi:hypothetical protein
MADKLENQVKDLKENIIQYKEKLNQDIVNHNTKDNLKEDCLDSTRKISDGYSKEGLKPEEIKAINNIENKNVRDVVKNRIDIERDNNNQKK